MKFTASRLQTSLFFAVILGLGDLGVLASHLLGSNYGFIAMLSFLFLPGYLFLKVLKVDGVELWTKAGLSLTFSLAILIFDGLFINAVLPEFGSSRPLALGSVVMCLNLTVLILIILACVRGVKIKAHIKNYALSEFLMLLGGILLVALSSAGAIRVNNGGSPILPVITIFIITIIIGLTIFKYGPTYKHAHFTLFIISFSLLLLWSLRSYHLSGGDIGLEHYVFNLTAVNNKWSIDSFRNPYNASLSITILPTILLKLSAYGSEWIFKIWYQLIFAFTVPIVFSYFTKIISKTKAFIAATFFCTQSVFILWLPMIAREEIALLFFSSLMLLIFGGLDISANTKKLLIYISAVALILSHYSTAYITAIVFIVATITLKIIKNKQLNTQEASLSYQFPSSIFIIIFVLLTFLWQAQITFTTNNFTSAIEDTYKGLSDSNGDNAKNNSANKIFSLNPFEGSDSSSVIKQYKDQQSSSPSVNSYKNAKDYEDDIQPSNPYIIPVRQPIIANAITIVSALDSILLRLSLLIGLVWVGRRLKRKNYDKLLAYSAGFVVLLIFLATFPFISTAFNLERLYQNALTILAVPIILGLYCIARLIARKGEYVQIVVFVAIVLFFWYNTGLTTQFTGGQPSALLNNTGYYYDQNYTTTQEVKAVGWLRQNATPGTKIYADKASQRVLASYGNFTSVDRDLLPDNISQNSYVYMSRSNTINNELFENLSSNNIVLSPPAQFLKANKNNIYTNNQSRIYR